MALPEAGEIARLSHAQWNANVAAYYAQLQELAPRLGPRSFEFFAETSLHDSRLVGFIAGARVEAQGFGVAASVPMVVLEVLDTTRGMRHFLRYRDVRRARFDYPTGEQNAA